MFLVCCHWSSSPTHHLEPLPPPCTSSLQLSTILYSSLPLPRYPHSSSSFQDTISPICHALPSYSPLLFPRSNPLLAIFLPPFQFDSPIAAACCPLVMPTSCHPPRHLRYQCCQHRRLLPTILSLHCHHCHPPTMPPTWFSRSSDRRSSNLQEE